MEIYVQGLQRITAEMGQTEGSWGFSTYLGALEERRGIDPGNSGINARAKPNDALTVKWRQHPSLRIVMRIKWNEIFRIIKNVPCIYIVEA